MLIIDDEPGLARALGRMLKEHAVTEAASAEEALALVEGGRDFDVVVCDVNLPVCSGPDLQGRLSALRPVLARRMVFTTGGALTEDSGEFLDQLEPWRLLEKPITPQRLREAVQRAVTQPLPAP